MILQVIEPISLMYSSVVANYKWRVWQTRSWGQVRMFLYTSTHTHTYVCECVWRWLVRLSVFACLVSAEWGRVLCNCKCQVWLPEPLCEPLNTHRSHWTRPGQQNSKHQAPIVVHSSSAPAAFTSYQPCLHQSSLLLAQFIVLILTLPAQRE